MSRWLDAVKRGYWSLDASQNPQNPQNYLGNTKNPVKSDAKQSSEQSPKTHPKPDVNPPKPQEKQFWAGFGGQPKGSENPANTGPNEVLGGFGGFGFWGVGYSREAINTGVVAAFAEYEASNDPCSPEAWR